MNRRIKNISDKILSKQWGTLKEVTFDYQHTHGNWVSLQREIYDRGDGAAALLYNVSRQTVLLVKQFRFPAYSKNVHSGFIIEACAGIQDEDDPEQTIIREIEEELGYRISSLQKVSTILTSPGAVTEEIHLFIAPYEDSQKIADGGGLAHENEDIEVIEYAFAKALQHIQDGLIADAKTIILLQHLALSGIMENN